MQSMMPHFNANGLIELFSVAAVSQYILQIDNSINYLNSAIEIELCSMIFRIILKPNYSFFSVELPKSQAIILTYGQVASQHMNALALTK